jgi:aminoglycoside phosphotransferase (APT) family kinase protein
LIDWEYTRIGDPAEDLAYLLTEQPVPASTVSALRRFYEEAGGALDTWRRVPAYGVFTALDSALWWADYLASRDLLRGRSEVEARLATAGGWLAGGFIR